MTTIHLAYTAPVNPPGGAGPELTQAQVFKGFQVKVRRPGDFVPAIAACDVLEDANGVVRRRVTFKPDGVRGQPRQAIEVCTEHAPHRVDFVLDNGSQVWNIVSGFTPAELYVTYVFAWVHPELDPAVDGPGSQAYAAVQAEHERVARLSVESSIATTRRLVAEGKL